MEAELEPLIDEARHAIEGSEEGRPVDVGAWRERLAARLSEEEAALVLADGSDEGRALDRLAEGIASVAPCTAELLEPEALADFARSEAIWDRAPLALRLDRFLEGRALAELARFEHAIARAARDNQVERLCVPLEALPDVLEEGVLVRNEAFERLAFEHDVVGVHAALSAGEPLPPLEPAPAIWLVGAFFDQVSVLPCPSGVDAAWERLGRGACNPLELAEIIDGALEETPEGWPEDGAAWIAELLEEGAIGWSGPEG